MNLPHLVVSFAISFSLLLVAMTVHEFAHGFTAYKLGDSTARFSGRLTLNPLAHIDPFWTVVLPLLLFISTSGHFVFGAAKPVPINYRALKNPKRDIIWIGLSGPLANFILAFVIARVLKVFPLPGVSVYLLFNLLLINVVLALFNLIPVPPLDGSRVIMGLLPEGLARQYILLERYGFIILFAFIWLGVFDRLLWPMVGAVIRLMGVG
ncbi:MAG: site-2 protease family protein [Candidatus Omnitrophica bacterium]|nr:site-2 protease family protein [Candidatus Omnitrophota bacterium]MDD5771219.1 site-2 protease family protein [Candidatus Omnitrophota bacterium]